MTQIVSASTPTRRNGVLAQQVRGDNPTVVLLDPSSGEYYTLEAVGMRIWELCDGTRTARDIATLLSSEFDAEVETVESDVLELLQDLVDETLVVIAR